MQNGMYTPGSGRPSGRPCPGGGRPSCNFPRFNTPCGSRGDWRNHESMRRDRFMRSDYTADLDDDAATVQPALPPANGWYGVPGVWEMMPGLDGGSDEDDI